MTDFRDMTVLELRELLWDNSIVHSRWMLTYIKKAEAISLLKEGEELTDEFTKILRERQARHMSNALAARKNRASQFGTSGLSHEERVKVIIEAKKPLKFLEVRTYDDGFTSATGSRRGKHAIVLVSESGEEVVMTKGEARIASTLGVSIPFSAFSSAKSSKPLGKKTIKDVFGE
jgi:hypothetical protein